MSTEAPYGCAYLRCADGALVCARVVVYKMKLRIIILINGQFLAGLSSTARTPDGLSVLGRRFWPVRARRIYGNSLSAKDARAMRARGIDPEAHCYQLATDWGSAHACLAHLRRHNPGIALIGWCDYESALAAQRTPASEAAA